MNWHQLPINLFDLCFVLMLVFGVLQGRKNGMSGELLNLIKWVCILLGCAALYGKVSENVTALGMWGQLGCYVVAYLVVGTIVLLVFTLLKNRIGSKLVGSDVFGKSEYYLGMGSGAIRALCIILVGLALLNARYYSTQEIRAKENYQQEVYGSDLFPGLHSVQAHVFRQSLIGPVIQEYCSSLFIKPTPATEAKKFQQRELTLP